MDDFQKVTGAQSWVWNWFLKNSKNNSEARCNVCKKVGARISLSFRLLSSSILSIQLPRICRKPSERRLLTQVLKTARNTSTLARHLERKHALSERTSLETPREQIPTCSKRRWENYADGTLDEPEEEEPPAARSRMATKQKQLDAFLIAKNTLRNDALRLVCESNVSLNEVVSSDVIRRLLSRSYPGDPPLPKSTSTLSKYLSEEASKFRSTVRLKFREIRAKGENIIDLIRFRSGPSRSILNLSARCISGLKLCCSFDEATVLGAARYLTINIHHHAVMFGVLHSVPLGVVRIEKSAKGNYLCDLINQRLQRYGLSRSDLAAATTDAGSNVVRAVGLLGLEQQKCYAHGLDLVVRKVVYGSKKKKALAFDIHILSPTIVEDNDEDVAVAEHTDESDDDASDESEIEQESVYPESDRDDVVSGSEPEEPASRVSLGSVIKNLRDVVRNLKRKPNLLDEIRRTTAKPEYNGKALTPKLDCPTRWYSTLLMIERAISIHPALNNVLSRHGTPISAHDIEALRKIAEVLAPFEKAILLLCKTESTLLHADKVFTLLLRDLEKAGTELGDMLSEHVKLEISKRRTVLSSVLAILEDPAYDFALERAVNGSQPSDDEMIAILSKILDASESAGCQNETARSVRFRSNFSEWIIIHSSIIVNAEIFS